RPIEQLDEWLAQMNEGMGEGVAPYAVNLIVHKSNARVEADLALCVKHRVPIIITSLGAREDVNQAVHSYGGIVFHDVINQKFARKAVEKGADGLIAVAWGAGGHAGTLSPFAFVQELRRWFAGPIALSGSIATGGAVLAAQAMGADFAYVGSAFIATEEARASAEYKQGVVEGTAEDIVYTNLFTGVHGNYLAASIRAAGMDPANLPEADPSKMNFGSGGNTAAKAWKDIWGCGQGIGVIDSVEPAAAVVDRLAREYAAARARLAP
ncbi:MAG: NAD(P)H-dependent flavin oxidoreductase, partial [Sphingomonadaceae bacterium]